MHVSCCTDCLAATDIFSFWLAGGHRLPIHRRTAMCGVRVGFGPVVRLLGPASPAACTNILSGSVAGDAPPAACCLAVCAPGCEALALVCTRSSWHCAEWHAAGAAAGSLLTEAGGSQPGCSAGRPPLLPPAALAGQGRQARVQGAEQLQQQMAAGASLQKHADVFGDWPDISPEASHERLVGPMGALSGPG